MDEGWLMVVLDSQARSSSAESFSFIVEVLLSLVVCLLRKSLIQSSCVILFAIKDLRVVDFLQISDWISFTFGKVIDFVLLNCLSMLMDSPFAAADLSCCLHV
ncbi:hypothetical protein Droror1_Dr00022758 [Drosera rotundifolia]